MASADPRAPFDEHKSPYQIESMVDAVVRNIRDRIDGRPPGACPIWSRVELADLMPDVRFLLAFVPEHLQLGDVRPEDGAVR